MTFCYSYDTRNGPFSEGVRWADESYLGDRSFFRINTDPPTLVIEDVKVSDQDLYTCKVEFKYRPNAITQVNLTVIGEYYEKCYVTLHIRGAFKKF